MPSALPTYGKPSYLVRILKVILTLQLCVLYCSLGILHDNVEDYSRPLTATYWCFQLVKAQRTNCLWD